MMLKLRTKKTTERFERSKRLEGHFSFNGRDLSKNVKGVNNKEDGEQKNAGVETSYYSSPDQHQGQPKEKLFYNISCGIKLLLNKYEENSKKKRKSKDGEQDDNKIAQMAASSLLLLVNVLDESNRFNQLDEMQNHMSKLLTEQQGDVQAANKEDSEKINSDKKQS
jgi:hypothetical protein